MAEETVFAKIIRGEISADIVYEDDVCLAFRDINPQAPIHVLVIPKEIVSGLQETKPEHRDLLGHLLLVVHRIAEQEGIGESGYRCIINAGSDGGQEVQHLHLHLLGGRRLGRLV